MPAAIEDQKQNQVAVPKEGGNGGLDNLNDVLGDDQVFSEFKKRKNNTRKTLITFFMYVAFVSVFTALVIGEEVDTYEVTIKQVEDRFSSGINEVRSITEFWNWFNGTFVTELYAKQTFDEIEAVRLSVPYKQWKLDDNAEIGIMALDEYNFLLGVARIRNVRVQVNTGCSIPAHFSQFYTECHGFYDSSNEAKEKYGSLEFPMTWRDEPYGVAFVGELATYNPGGYFFELDANKARGQNRANQYKDGHFIDMATRFIGIDLPMWNVNTGRYAITRIAFEVAATGEWISHSETIVIRERNLIPFGFEATSDWLSLIGDLFLLVLVLYYVAEEFSELAIARWSYFNDGWNLLDWANLILLVVADVIKLNTWLDHGTVQIGAEQMRNVLSHPELMHIASNVQLVRTLNAFNCVLVWLKVTKFLPWLPFVRLFKETVSASWTIFLSAIFVMLTFFFGFVLAFTTAFGDYYTQYQTFGSSFVYLTRIFMGDISMQSIVDAGGVLGVILLFLWFAAVILLMVNIWMGAYIYAVSAAQIEIAETKDDDVEEAWEAYYTVVAAIEGAFNKIVYDWIDVDEFIPNRLPGLYARMKRNAYLQKKRDNKRMRMIKRKEKESTSHLRHVNPSDPKAAMPAKYNLGALSSKPQTGKSRALVARQADHIEVTPQLLHDCGKIVIQDFNDRVYAVSDEVKTELLQCNEVISTLNDVVTVLASRTKDLQMQQDQYLNVM